MPTKRNSSDLEVLGLLIGIVSGIITIIREIVAHGKGAKMVLQQVGGTLRGFILGLQFLLMMLLLFTCGVTLMDMIRWSAHSKIARFLVTGFPLGSVDNRRTGIETHEWRGLRDRIPAASIL